MKNKKIETYNPKKTILEKIKPFFKIMQKIFIILIIISITVAATKYAIETNNPKPNHAKISNHVIIHRVNLDNPQNQNFNSTKETDYSTLIQDLLKNEMIKNLPKNAVLKLQFYNYNSGQRTWKKSYNLKKNYVQEGNEEGDIQIIVHSKYVKELKNKDLCEVLMNAKMNGDFEIETKLSQGALIWKYRNMLKYRNCLGF
jgi:hypothetical protein